MIGSFFRVLTIARNTLTEAIRQRVLNVLLIFAIVLVGSSVFVSGIATPGLNAAGLYDEQIKFVKDFGCGAIGLFGAAIALLSTAQLIPQELEKRTIYTILAKPVRRAEFLFGKFFGSVLLLALCVTLMSLAFAGAMAWQESQGIAFATQDYGMNDPHAHPSPDLISAYQHEVLHIKQQVRDPQLIKAIVLLFAKLVMTMGLALFISTFATSSIFTIVTTFLLYLIGHLEGVARDVWLAQGASASIWQNGLLSLLALLVPDFNSFTIVDEILAGNHVPLAHVMNLLAYAGVYLIVLLALSELTFRHREL
jgi:ABC-type Na+ efflux pump permease subunit